MFSNERRLSSVLQIISGHCRHERTSLWGSLSFDTAAEGRTALSVSLGIGAAAEGRARERGPPGN
jgi:hypothetical protein